MVRIVCMPTDMAPYVMYMGSTKSSQPLLGP
jgi:hypothetical protein